MIMFYEKLIQIANIIRLEEFCFVLFSFLLFMLSRYLYFGADCLYAGFDSYHYFLFLFNLDVFRI